jgi:hypothetical protein
MPSCPNVRRALLALCFGWVFFLGIDAKAAAFDVNDTDWEGTSELLSLARTRLGNARVEIVASLDWEKMRPGDGLLILHPTVDLEYDEASAFLRAGGRIALLDDYGKGNTFLERFQIKRVSAPDSPKEVLRGKPALAIAVPAVQIVAAQEQGRHPVVAQVQQLVTNHPTALVHPNLTPVLEIPANGEPSATLAVTGIIVNRGRLFAMGDPSAMINLMLRYPGNRAFAEGLVDYLVEDDSWGARGGKLYIVANDFKQQGAYGGGTSMAQDIREQISAVEELIASFHDDGLPELLALLLAVVVGVGAVGWAGLTATRPYKRAPPRYAKAQPLVAQGGVAGRAAVLGAPTTHKALALLELKSALEKALGQHLGLAAPVAAQTLAEEVDRQGALSKGSSEELKRILMELGRAENRVAVSQPLKVTQQAVEEMRHRVQRILDELSRTKGGE